MNILEVKHLRKSFGGLRAVDDFSCEVKKGCITGLIGPNGAGKTTVFNLITRFLLKDKGKVLFHGKEITHAHTHEIVRKGIARTFQQIRLFPELTVKQNLLLSCSHQYDHWWKSFGKPDESTEEERVKEMLALVGLEKKWHQKAGDLSYGQTKLVEILRILLLEAELVLLDEPAAGVNPTMLRTVEELITRLKKQGKTVMIIEHNMNFLMRMADEIIVMENGKFLCHDTPEAVQKDPRVLASYLGGT